MLSKLIAVFEQINATSAIQATTSPPICVKRPDQRKPIRHKRSSQYADHFVEQDADNKAGKEHHNPRKSIIPRSRFPAAFKRSFRIYIFLDKTHRIAHCSALASKKQKPSAQHQQHGQQIQQYGFDGRRRQQQIQRAARHERPRARQRRHLTFERAKPLSPENKQERSSRRGNNLAQNKQPIVSRLANNRQKRTSHRQAERNKPQPLFVAKHPIRCAKNRKKHHDRQVYA